MSQEKLELQHRLTDAFNRRDLDAYLALRRRHRGHPARGGMEGGYHGHEGTRRWWTDLLGSFPDFSVEFHEVHDMGGNLTLAAGRARAHGAGSDTPIEQVFWQVVRWRRGRCSGGPTSTHGPQPSRRRGCRSRRCAGERGDRAEVVRRVHEPRRPASKRKPSSMRASCLTPEAWSGRTRISFGCTSAPKAPATSRESMAPCMEEMRVEVRWIRGVGDRVLSWLHQQQVGRVSGLPVDFFLAWDILFRDGKIVRVAFPETSGRPSKPLGCGPGRSRRLLRDSKSLAYIRSAESDSNRQPLPPAGAAPGRRTPRAVLIG